MKIRKVILCAAVFSIALLVTGCGRTKVDLNDYLTLECEGYDTVGKADFTFDYEKLIDDNPKAFGLSKDYSDEDYLGVLLSIDSYIDGDLDKTDSLSNGDTVTFKWDVDEENLNELFPISAVYSDKKLEVSGGV